MDLCQTLCAVGILLLYKLVICPYIILRHNSFNFLEKCPCKKEDDPSLGAFTKKLKRFSAPELVAP